MKMPVRTMRGILSRRIFSTTTIPFTRKRASPSISYVDASFLAFSQEYLTYIHKVFLPLVPLNPEMKITQTDFDILIDLGVKGKFRFRIDEDKENLILSSPTSGLIPYYYDPESGQWLSVKDRHDLRGLVTRDWLRTYGGCPQFE